MKRAYLVVWATFLAAAAYAESDRSPGQRAHRLGPETSLEVAVAPLDVPDAGTQVYGPIDVAGAPAYHLNWVSVNGGGSRSVVGTNFRMGLSAGQEAVDVVTGTHYRLGMGYWYGARGGACPIAMPGDVNTNGAISASDIIVLVNFVFKAGPDPLPCTGNGDVNCNGAVSSSDIIYLVNKVFRAGPEPCDVCVIIPSMWSCP